MVERFLRSTWDIRWSLSSTGIGLDVVRTSENLDCRISFYTIVFAEVCLFSAVNLDQGNVLLLEGGGSFFILRSQSLAMATPRSEELSEDQIMLFDKVLEGVSLQVVDI